MDKRSPWYPPTMTPVHVGWYECELCIRHTDNRHYWTGTEWLANPDKSKSWLPRNARWRGLAHPPKEEP